MELRKTHSRKLEIQDPFEEFYLLKNCRKLLKKAFYKLFLLDIG